MKYNRGIIMSNSVFLRKLKKAYTLNKKAV